jgi:hypothetical protein
VSDGEVSSPDSSAAADPFLADRGQPFDAETSSEEAAAAAADLPDVPVDLDLVLWTATRVRRLLTIQGQVTHTFVGVAEHDWLWQENELAMICEPLAEFANRTPALAALAHLSDDAAIGAGFLSYALRSYRERLVELRHRKAQEQVPVTGRAPTADETPANPEDGTEWTL